MANYVHDTLGARSVEAGHFAHASCAKYAPKSVLPNILILLPFLRNSERLFTYETRVDSAVGVLVTRLTRVAALEKRTASPFFATFTYANLCHRK